MFSGLISFLYGTNDDNKEKTEHTENALQEANQETETATKLDVNDLRQENELGLETSLLDEFGVLPSLELRGTELSTISFIEEAAEVVVAPQATPVKVEKQQLDKSSVEQEEDLLSNTNVASNNASVYEQTTDPSRDLFNDWELLEIEDFIEQEVVAEEFAAGLDSPAKTKYSDKQIDSDDKQLVVSKQEAKVKQIVASIKPERAPAWQLKRKRSHRKPLTLVNSVTNCKTKAHNSKRRDANQHYSASASGSTNLDSSPIPASASRNILFERVNSTIVSNLNNLANTIGSSQTNRFENLIDCNEQRAEDLSNTTNMNDKFLFHKSKEVAPSYLIRNNKVVMKNSSVKRVDRRTKMHTKLNGVSINRKVHTNFNTGRPRTVNNVADSIG